MAPILYLHWTATGNDWIRPGHYHSIIAGDGRVHRLHDYDVDLPAHTWARNSNSVALACACMGGRPDPWAQPPTAVQLTSLWPGGGGDCAPLGLGGGRDHDPAGDDPCRSRLEP